MPRAELGGSQRGKGCNDRETPLSAQASGDMLIPASLEGLHRTHIELHLYKLQDNIFFCGFPEFSLQYVRNSYSNPVILAQRGEMRLLLAGAATGIAVAASNVAVALVVVGRHVDIDCCVRDNQVVASIRANC